MKKIVSILFFIPLFAAAQKDITHTVAPKESLSSIGRKYNINPRELAKYNKLDYDKGLSIGQVLKVPGKGKAVAVEPEPPVKATPKTAQVTTKPAPANTGNEEGQPIYHIVAPKETLYHISITNGKVPIADIKRWNHLTSDGVNEGTKLIIGYSKTAGAPVETPVVKNEPVKETPVVTVPEKPEVKPAVKEPVAAVVKNDPPANRNINFNGGYFKSSYQGGNGNGETVTAAVFKSNNSGWSDGKYYCLHNTAPQGSIIKITNADGKSIYAKVLDVMPDLKQNSGLSILISNAAAAELGVGENKFDCTINYSR